MHSFLVATALAGVLWADEKPMGCGEFRAERCTEAAALCTLSGPITGLLHVSGSRPGVYVAFEGSINPKEASLFTGRADNWASALGLNEGGMPEVVTCALFSKLGAVALSSAVLSQKKSRSSSGLSAEEAAEGFVPLFDGKSLKGWIGLNGDTSSYYVKDGMLICKSTGKVHIFTEKQYSNFILRLQIKMDPGGNNGIGIRTRISREPHLYGMEIQVLDDDYYADGDPIKLKDYQHHGSIYGVVPAKTGHLKPAGQWNDQEILCDGRRVRVTLNGVVIVDADLDKVKPLDGRKHPGLKYKKGHISLHAHGNYGAQVYFRNIRIKELD